MSTPACARPMRRGSFRVAPWQRQRLGHADKLAIMDAARRLERRTRQPGQHGGALKRTGIMVLWNLLYRGWSRSGACDPALAQLAEWAACARSTVQEAIRRIEAAGIMGHVRRGLPVTVRGVTRWVQWCSAYLFADPALWRGWSPTEFRQPLVSKSKRGLEEKGASGARALPEAELASLAERWGLNVERNDGFIRQADARLTGKPDGNTACYAA